MKASEGDTQGSGEFSSKMSMAGSWAKRIGISGA